MDDDDDDMNVEFEIPEDRNLMSCEVVKMDFDTLADGSPVEAGSYVRKDWLIEYGVNIRAFGIEGAGYTPDEKGRIFDSSSPGNSVDLGSPNNKCDPPGPGSGVGGRPGEPGENCVPQGNLLIIQDGTNIDPDDPDKVFVPPADSPAGGFLNFYFIRPTFLQSVTVLDINTSRAYVKIYRVGKGSRTYKIPRKGHNSAQEIVIERSDVYKIHVFFPGNGAVSDLSFCPVQFYTESPSSTPTIAPTPPPVTCLRTDIVYEQDFESPSYDVAKDWRNGMLEYDPGFTTFLGRFVNGDNFPILILDVPADADKVVIEFDFYEIDSWNGDSQNLGPDSVAVGVQFEIIDMGVFHSDIDEGMIMGQTPESKIWWESKSQGTPSHIGFREDKDNFRDQIHRFKLTVPNAVFSSTGNIILTLMTLVSGTKVTDESGGYDTFKITVFTDCATFASVNPLPSESPSMAPSELVVLTPPTTAESSPPSASPVGDPTTGTLSGYVLNDNGNGQYTPLVNAQVGLYNGHTHSVSTFTNTMGYWEFTGVPLVSYAVRMEAPSGTDGTGVYMNTVTNFQGDIIIAHLSVSNPTLFGNFTYIAA